MISMLTYKARLHYWRETWPYFYGEPSTTAKPRRAKK